MGVLDDAERAEVIAAVARLKHLAAMRLALETPSAKDLVSAFDDLYVEVTEAFDEANDRSGSRAAMLADFETQVQALEARYAQALQHSAVREAYGTIRVELVHAISGDTGTDTPDVGGEDAC